MTRSVRPPASSPVRKVAFGSAGSPVAKNSGVITPPFSPLDLSPALWLDASDTATITQVANAVSQWNDKSGNARHATQGTGSNQPITGSSINGRNAIDFDGSNDRLIVPAAILTGTGNLTWFFLVKPDGFGSNNQIFRFNVTGGHEANVAFYTTGTELSFGHTASFQFSALSLTADTTPQIIGCWRGGSSQRVTKNGTLGSASTGAETVTGITGGQIGSDIFGGLAFNGLVAEVIVYHRDLSTQEKNQIGSYLAAKWGVTWTPF